MAGVKLEKIFKSYGTVEVVHGIDLEVREKEFVVLVGPSGCGKSTTLRMVAGLEEISSGVAHIDGRLINNVAPKDRDVAMVFQNYALYPHLTVAKNIAFGLNIRRVPKAEVQRQVKEVAEILELTDYLDRRPSELSGGQRQRVAMGRAIVRHPKVFLFDEPLSNLDAKLRSQMRAEIKKLHTRLGVTSLYVTHDQVEAMTLADRIVVMQDGVIEQIGTPMELFQNPANLFVASFIGSPPMNQIDAVLQNTSKGPVAEIANNIKLPLRAAKGFKGEDGKDIVIGIRPEHVLLKPSKGYVKVPCELTLVEPLGSEALVHTEVNNVPFIIKAETYGDITHLNAVNCFYVRAADVRAFDKATGEIISDQKLAVQS